jgi:dihydroneopterin aldolase
MIGTVGLNDLRIDCVIGIYPDERTATQPIFVDVEVEYDFAAAARTEQIENALDYDRLARDLEHLAVERQYQLLETFAEEAASHCLRHFSAINMIRLAVRKPKAVQKAAAAFAKIERGRA